MFALRPCSSEPCGSGSEQQPNKPLRELACDEACEVAGRAGPRPMGAGGAAAGANRRAGDHAARACRRVLFTCKASDEARGRA